MPTIEIGLIVMNQAIETASDETCDDMLNLAFQIYNREFQGKRSVGEFAIFISALLHIAGRNVKEKNAAKNAKT